MDSKGCWLIQIEGGCGTACVYACNMVAAKCARHVLQATQIDGFACLIQLRHCVEFFFLFAFPKKLFTIPTQIISNLPLFHLSIFVVFDGRLGQVLLPIQWWWRWCRTQWWPWWWGVQAIHRFRQFRSKGMPGTMPSLKNHQNQFPSTPLFIWFESTPPPSNKQD